MRNYCLTLSMCLCSAFGFTQHIASSDKENVYISYFEDVQRQSTPKHCVAVKGLLQNEIVFSVLGHNEDKESLIGDLESYIAGSLDKEQTEMLLVQLNVYTGPSSIKLGDYLEQDPSRANLIIQLYNLLDFDNKLDRKLESDRIKIKTIRNNVSPAKANLLGSLSFPYCSQKIVSVSQVAISDDGKYALFLMNRYGKKGHGSAIVAFLNHKKGIEWRLDQTFELGHWW